VCWVWYGSDRDLFIRKEALAKEKVGNHWVRSFYAL